MSYNYGPPPPPPGPAPPAPSGSAPYAHPYGPPTARGGHSARGRGGPDRGTYHQTTTPGPSPSYPYGGQHPQSMYSPGAQPAAPYTGPHQPVYPPSQQHWTPSAAPATSQPPAAPIPPPGQNYQASYATPPQAYPPQHAPYGGHPQPPYGQHSVQPYNNGYPQSSFNAPPNVNQSWSGHPQPPSNTPYPGAGRARGAHNDRSAPKGPIVAPPIRLGFDAGNPSASPAPVSTHYPYGAPPPAPPAPYPVPPVTSYAPPPPVFLPTKPSFESRPGHGSRNLGRGGYHNNNRSKLHNNSMNNRHRAQNRSTGSSAPPQPQRSEVHSGGKKKKRRTNTLGLTPVENDAGSQADSDNDENEEERLNELYGLDAPNPQTESEIAAWIAERRANYPTKAKIAARRKAEEEQRLEARREKLRKKLEEVESTIKRKRALDDDGDDVRDRDATLSRSSTPSSDDEAPEVLSSRQESNVPPPPKKADTRQPCKYYSFGGNCGKKDKCRFVHDDELREKSVREQRENGGRLTLRQRLALNDKEIRDRACIETLIYLRQRNVLPPKKEVQAVTSTPSNENGDNKEPSSPASGGNASPHTASPESRTNQNSKDMSAAPSQGASGSSDREGKYVGWNLNGFGNTVPKSSD